MKDLLPSINPHWFLRNGKPPSWQNKSWVMRITKASKCLKRAMPGTQQPLGASDIPERAPS